MYQQTLQKSVAASSNMNNKQRHASQQELVGAGQMTDNRCSSPCRSTPSSPVLTKSSRSVPIPVPGGDGVTGGGGESAVVHVSVIPPTPEQEHHYLGSVPKVRVFF
jgi:hypothetical protein